MGNILDYQGPNPNPTPPTGPCIYARYLFRVAVVGSVVLVLISLYQLSEPWEFQTTGPVGYSASMVGWGAWFACPILGRRADVSFWIVGILLALGMLLLIRGLSGIQTD